MTDRKTPFDLIAAHCPAERVLKAEVLSVCSRLEGEAVDDPPEVAVATVQDMRFASPRARRVWRDLAAAGTKVSVFGRDLPAFVTDGVAGISLDDDDPAVDVWSFLVRWADGRCSAMAAADVGQRGRASGLEDLRRDFDLVVTEDPGLVASCLTELGAAPAD